MKRFNHKMIAKTLNNNFKLESYTQGKFTHFKKDGSEIGFIEQIGATKSYLQTIMINFFCMEDLTLNDKIVKGASDLYKDQKMIIDKNVQGLNVCLEQRGTEICKATLI